MSDTLRVVLAQQNFLVGDIAGNLEKHMRLIQIARDELKADLIVFPELSLTGYPPEDLLLRPAFLKEASAALTKLITNVFGIYCLVGHPQQTDSGIFNACSLIYNQKIIDHYAKQCLPNYGVFDENRYFIPGSSASIVTIKNIPIGIVICEDAWLKFPIEACKASGAKLILIPNASPFEVNKHELRSEMLSLRANENQVPLLYVNQVAGQDELIFDGGSMAIGANGNIAQFAGFFTETLLPVDISIEKKNVTFETLPFSLPSAEEKIYQALVLSVRDYVRKNHFRSVILGLSGGIDSALTLAIAVDALGADCVHAVMMPSPFTSEISLEDAALVAKNLDVKYDIIAIEPAYQQLLISLQPLFADKKSDVTEENLQARIRGMLLMALSNKFGHLVLSASNRSEMAVGYCTLYGDMVGGFAPLKDVPKTLVYHLANYRNKLRPVIPERTITRAPSAELAPNQKDEDSLPPYDILDAILMEYLNNSKSIEEIVAAGFDETIVTKVVNLIRCNEYKRRQATPGPHIRFKSFGKDWRYPITNGFKG